MKTQKEFLIYELGDVENGTRVNKTYDSNY